MVPGPVAVGERAHDIREQVRTDGLVERCAEPSVGHHAQLPRTASSLDAAVIRRGIRRPAEPGGDREIGGRYGNRRSRNPVSRVEVPSPTDFPRDVRRARQCPMVSMPGEILHPSVRQEGLHVVLKDGTGGRQRRCEGSDLRIA